MFGLLYLVGLLKWVLYVLYTGLLFRFLLTKCFSLLLFSGTFGRIFHGILIEEKDPSKEKQMFVKTVKGRFYQEFYSCLIFWHPMACFLSTVNTKHFH